jgi:astacin (peptidase family M12A)
MAAKDKTQGAYLGSKLAAGHRYCAARFPQPVKLPAGLAQERARLIRQSAGKWMNGSTIRYWFFDKPAKYAGAASQKAVVRKAFAQWKALGIGLHFKEVKSRANADVRIAFLEGDGAWSYIGTDVLRPRTDPRTMNFGWSLTDDPDEGLDTALHEIGHTLGFPHEHQNPFAGIVWDEKAVYKSLAGEPNFWDRSTTFRNILEKIAPDAVQGSKWDPNSVMHYPFERGLITKPAKYRKGLTPAGGLSARDRQWALTFYPGAAAAAQLTPFQTLPVTVSSGQQCDFAFKPLQTRDYEFRTFGDADVVMALYATRGSGARPIAQEDDSGREHNAALKTRLRAGEEYVLRLRMRYAKPGAPAAVMVW